MRKLSTKKEPIVKRHEKMTRLPPRNSPFPNHVTNLGFTKSWQRETSRCKASGDKLRLLWPQLHHLADSPYNPSVANHHLQELVIDTSATCILPSRNAEIPSKFSPINFVPARCVALVPYHINPSATRLELSDVSGPTLMLYNINQVKNKIGSIRYECSLTKYECNTVDPFDVKRKCMQFTSIIKFEGVVFALSLQGALAIMQEIDSRLTITAMSSTRGVPSVNSRFFKDYLLDLNGEILLIFLINQKTTREVDKVEVFRLCFPDLKWIKVARIQGKTLFLNHECRIYVNSIQNDSMKDCIYFTQGSNNCWWKYDMGHDCISPA
ncbi:hypothetical protein ABFS82_03G014000 [Erythranthe guttata]